jgi:hypothetical protein
MQEIVPVKSSGWSSVPCRRAGTEEAPEPGVSTDYDPACWAELWSILVHQDADAPCHDIYLLKRVTIFFAKLAGRSGGWIRESPSMGERLSSRTGKRVAGYQYFAAVRA